MDYMIDDIRDKVKETGEWIDHTRKVLDEIDTELFIAMSRIEDAQLVGNSYVEEHLIRAMEHVKKAKNMAEDL